MSTLFSSLSALFVRAVNAVYALLWHDLITLPLPGGGTLGLSLLVLLLVPLLIFFAVLPAVVTVVSGALRLPAAQRVTLTMTTTARNSPIALSIAVAAFPDRPLIAVALVIGPLLELPVLAVLAQIVRARPGSPTGSGSAP